ncbi:MAG: hypothetical protein NUV49_00685 [Patescibacteria group bacterium]|nr:hypothetical protein [Patescibacteria group bacterium]
MNYDHIASEVAVRLKKGEDFRSAAGEVLRRHHIKEDWSSHMAEIGKRLGARKKRKQKFPRMSREDILADLSHQRVLEDTAIVAGERHDKFILDL